MFTLTVIVGPSGAPMNFMFKTFAAADAELKSLTNEIEGSALMLTLKDDFGHSAIIIRDSLHGFVLDDLSLSGDAQVEIGLHQARTQAKANTKAMSDPVLKFAAGGGSPLMRG